MSRLISFALASSSCKERKRDLQNEKFFLPIAGLELTTFGFEAIDLTARPRRPDTLLTCYLNLHDNTWQSVFSCIQYCTHITSVLFCGLNNTHTEKTGELPTSLPMGCTWAAHGNFAMQIRLPTTSKYGNSGQLSG